MRNIKIFLFIGFCLLVNHTAFSESSEKLAKDYSQLFSSITDLQVDFEQTLYTRLRDRTHSRQGKAFFSKPANFRWNFNDKRTGLEEFYFDGTTLTHFKEKEALVTHYKANVGLARELREVVNLVLDPTTLFERYSVTTSRKTNDTHILELSPRSAVASDIEQLTVEVTQDSRFVKIVKINYVDGNYTQFAFSKPTRKKNPLNIFTFSRKGKFSTRSHG